MAKYTFTKITDEELIVYHVSDDLFDKFDITKKHNTSDKNGIGFNFNISGPQTDGENKYIYKCKLNLTNPFHGKERTVSTEKWKELKKALEIKFPGVITSYANSDWLNYLAMSEVFSFNNSDKEFFLQKVKEVLGVDGYISHEDDLAVCFEADKIKILEIKEK